MREDVITIHSNIPVVNHILNNSRNIQVLARCNIQFRITNIEIITTLIIRWYLNFIYVN